jgi:serine/threonine protein phosphatase PrpC
MLSEERQAVMRDVGESLAEPVDELVGDETITEGSPTESAAGLGETEEGVPQEPDGPPSVAAEAESAVEPEAEVTVAEDGATELEDEAEAAAKMDAERLPSEPSTPERDVQVFWRDKPEPLVPLELQTMIDDRYEIVEVLAVQEDEIHYMAHDLRGCWQCGFADNIIGDSFCAQCGVSLERKPEVRLLEVRQAEAEPSGGAPVAARLAHEGRTLLVVVEPSQETQASSEPESLRLLFGQRSHPGQVRELNEDGLLAMILAPTYESQTMPVQGLFAVADGMGGHEGGEVASRMALQIVAHRVLRTLILPGLDGEMVPEEEVAVRIHLAILAANDAIYLARQKAENDMGTTLTVAFVRDAHLFLGHVGDCRVYRWNAEGLEQLTTDHSVVASMVASGQAAPEDVYTHPHRSVIYRSIGDKPTVEVDVDRQSLAPGDRLVLCSDGLWEMLRTDGIQDVMLQESDPQVACDLLVSRANAAGGDDNISVVVLQVAVV